MENKIKLKKTFKKQIKNKIIKLQKPERQKVIIKKKIIKKEIVCSGSGHHKLKELIRKKISFKMTMTQNHYKFVLENGMVYKYFRKNRGMDFFGILSRLKKEVRAGIKRVGGDKIPIYNEDNIRYYYFGTTLTKTIGDIGDTIEIRDAIEYDMTKAYYQSFYILGYISQEFYYECITLPKAIRLKLLGSIATNKQFFEYKEGKEVDNPIEPIEDEEKELMKRAWFHACKFVDNCIWQFREALGDDFLMYWVDGIVFKRKALPKAESFMMYAIMQYGLMFKIVEIDKILLKYEKNRHSIEIYKEDGKKVFEIPRKQRADYRVFKE